MLGSSRKYAIIARLTLADIFEYRLDNLIRIGRYALTVSFMLFLWLAIARETSITEINIDQLIQYYVAAIVIYGISNYHLDYVEADIRLGYMSKYLLKPISAYGHYFIHQGTVTFYDIILKALFFLPILGLFYGVTLLSWHQLGTVLLLLISGYFTTFSLYFTFSIMAFWFQQVDSLRMTALFIGRYLSGVLIPFYLFPDTLQEILWWTPFPHYAYTPIALATGQIETLQALQGLGILTVWGIVFYICNQLLWDKATHAYEGTGI